MSHHHHTDDIDPGCCEESAAPRGILVKDPWECYEGDTDTCAADPADVETEADADCGCCCCC